MTAPVLPSIGSWYSDSTAPSFDFDGFYQATRRCREAVHVIEDPATHRVGVAFGGRVQPEGAGPWRLIGTLPPLYPEWLGDRSFQETHRTRFGYVAGAMANGIATTTLVEAMAHAGMLGFFGAAGLPPDRVEAALDRLQTSLGDRYAWGSNLIHSPHEPDLEAAIADMLLRRGVRRISASAYMALTPPIVRAAFSGIREQGGEIVRKTFIFAKISRPETAAHFLSPPPQAILDALVSRGELTVEEARLARHLPVAEDITIEADSGGHTDNQVLTALFPTIVRVRDEMVQKHRFSRPIRLGAAGGLGSPDAVAAAFALGAAYVLTGSVNQACVESGLCDNGRAMLAQAKLGDVVMAPAADMFEMGVKVQVLKRGTLFGPRALRLYDIYKAHAGLHDLPAAVRDELERRILGRPIDDIWQETHAFFSKRDPSQVECANRDPKHKMALVFRWYLGLSSRWAIAGEPSRAMDYQIWCGPAMCGFNAWTAGTWLADPTQRKAVDVALNLLDGAAIVTRAGQLRSYGVAVPTRAFHVAPRRLSLPQPYEGTP